MKIKSPDSIAIPYMGSKRKLASKICKFIIDENPNVKYIYDLFGGGGAISFEFLKYDQIKKIVYNELNTGVCELLKDIIKNGITEKYCQWVDRGTFMKHKNDDDWFGGLLKTCWSFGNNQREYLFGKDIEEIKKQAHLYLFENGYKLGDKGKRIELIKQFKNDKNIIDRFELERLESLERLERLERLESLERLQQLEIQNKSYEDVIIETPLNETIIYLDPPYINKGCYQKKLNIDELYKWIKESKYKIYLSSYESPLYECKSYEHRCILSATVNNKVVEKLFCNKEYINKDFDISLF
jgi:16S rRNA G966 N2-methylase RsmD